MADDVGVNFGKNRTGDHDRTAAKSNARSAIERLAIPAFAVGVAIACVSLVAVDWNVWTVGRSSQSTDDAVISADVATVSAQVSGVLRRIGVNDYQSVKKGDLLAELDDREFVAAEDAARANLESANAAVANLSNQMELQKSVIKAAEAQNMSAIAQLDQTREEFNRQTSLGGATSQQMLQQAQAAYLQAKASVRATSSAIDQQRAQLKVLIGQYPALKALADVAKAQLETAAIKTSYTRIYAPNDGVVGKWVLHDGEVVSSGSALVSIVPLPSVYVIANFKETQLANMRPGGRAELDVDTFPGQRLHGTVSTLSPASGSVFALLPPDNASGNYTKVVQRVPVKIQIDPDQRLIDKLRPGMSVYATVETLRDLR